MGPPYFTTLNYTYLFSNNDPSKSVNLTKKNVIIDGYSFVYFIYYMTNNENKPIATALFEYDGLSENFRNILKQFKDNCANVDVVLDGIFEPNKHRRPAPKRDSTIQFNNSRSHLPPLLCDLFMSILRELNITVHIAPGEADPKIVQMARKYNAYIVARDSDYFLYGDTKGYVPLDALAFPTLEGKYYHMKDVFQGMTQQGVALWAITIVYDFISLDVLQVIMHFLSLNEILKCFFFRILEKIYD